MDLQSRSATALTFLSLLALALASSQLVAQNDGIQALAGEWTYVEDRTEGRALEQLGPPMSTTFAMRIEDAAVILVRGHGSGHRDVRIALDASMTEVTVSGKTSRYRGAWKDGALTYEVDFVRTPGKPPEGLIRREFRITADGLLVRAHSGTSASIGLYRHAEDIPMPAPVKATIGDLAWLAGAWLGKKSSGSSIEERWSPPLGGAMLGTSRTVSRGKMSGFEFLRIVERDGGLVYIAQPGGKTPTDFVLTEVLREGTTTRAVFDNPRHDYPKRILYELSADGRLTTTVGFMKGGTPRRFEYERDGD